MYYLPRTTLVAVRGLRTELSTHETQSKGAFQATDILLIYEYNGMLVVKLSQLTIYCSKNVYIKQ